MSSPASAPPLSANAQPLGAVPRRVPLLGVQLSICTYATATAAILAAARAGRPLGATALAVHGVMEGALSPALRLRLNALDLITPDGQPVRWGLNWRHRAGLRDRVYGPNLMLEVCAGAARDGLPIFLYGTTADTLAKLEESLLARFPGLVVAGSLPSRFRALDVAEQATVAASIRASGARLCFVGLGCPRQELFVAAMASPLAMPCLAVGAAFDFHAGTAKQAPLWMQRRGLEWLYRLWHHPQRLWRRYLLLNPAYVVLLALDILGLRRLSPTPAVPPNPLCPG